MVDHGAQYFTMRDERFRAAVQRASGEAVLKIEAPVMDENGRELENDGRWYHRDGNSRLARELAGGLDVKTEVTIERAEPLLRGQGGEYDHVISTAPLPQTARLFGIKTTFQYLPCLMIVCAYSGEWLGKTRGCYAISDHSSPLAWSACENHKIGRIAAGRTVLVAQMSEQFSREHLEEPPETYPELVRTMIEERWELPPGTLMAAMGHRWRYARIRKPLGKLELPSRFHFAGDALTSSRVEDAWLAGMKAVEKGPFFE